MRRLTVVLALAVVAAVSACGGAGPADTPAETGAANQITTQRMGIRLTLSINGETHQVGQSVKIGADARNMLAQPIQYGPSIPGQPVFSLAVTSELMGTQILNKDYATIKPGDTLSPGASVRAETEWDQQLNLYQTPVQAPPGQYSITAELVVAGPEGSNGIPVTVSAKLSLEGGEPVILPQDAMKTAIANEDVKAWFEERVKRPVCAYGDRGLFYVGDVNAGTVNESLDIVYKANVENGYPICGVVSEEGAWRLIFYGKDGPAPNRISAFVDIHTGAFLRMEEGGPTGAVSSPTPTPAPSR